MFTVYLSKIIDEKKQNKCYIILSDKSNQNDIIYGVKTITCLWYRVYGMRFL